MAKPEWGTKRMCPNCGARFYDMRRNPVECPNCGGTSDTSSPVRVRRGAPPPVPLPPPPEPVLDEDVAPEIEVEGIEEIEDEEAEEGALEQMEAKEEEELIEDASDLGEDTDDMAEVMEHIDEDVADKV